VAALSSLTLLALRIAIAPVPVGHGAAPGLQRAFQDELPKVIAESGAEVVPPNEVDLHVAEKPELTRCTRGECLEAEAALLQVERLVVPRFDRQGSGYVVALALYDATEKRFTSEQADRCDPCTADRIREVVREVGRRLFAPLAPKVVLDTVPPPLVEKRAPRFRVVRWVLLGLGVGAVAAGGALLGIDSRPACGAAPPVQCQTLYDTVATGAPLVGVGGAMVLTSIVMIGLDARR
jgi:hypothetical protein